MTNKNRLSAKTEIGGKPVQNRSRTAKGGIKSKAEAFLTGAVKRKEEFVNQ